jgi:hypothetical protein
VQYYYGIAPLNFFTGFFSLDNELIASVSESFARMRARHLKRKAQNIAPECECAKCHSAYWEQTDGYDWFCFRCGNRGHWVDGKFVQSGNVVL